MVNGVRDPIHLVALISIDMSTLLVLAGGIGSRYGGDKQISAVGPNGEFIMEYAIYDAINNGFKNIIILSSAQFIPSLKKKLSYLLNRVSLHFVDQHKNDINYPNYRKKPWGTAHAVWACRKKIKGYFLVVNADDFYGGETFQIANAVFNEVQLNKVGLITFCLKNTLSHNGGVSRGLCIINKTRLLAVSEHTNIAQHKMNITSNESIGPLIGNTQVSMNCWILHSNIFFALDNYFQQFYLKYAKDSHAECGLPDFIQSEIENGKRYNVYLNKSKWFGLTHPGDLEWCRYEVKCRVEEGSYPKILSSTYE
tara:strand:- start:3237 stop:4166 length:930 start_codon:yes stop_codon:yes gene_type:complete